MNFKEEFLLPLLKNNIPIELSFDKEAEELGYVVSGFYKSGTVILIPNEHSVLVKARYNEQTTIDTLGQLVGINNLWWERSKGRYEGWSNPDSMWISLLKEFGYIKEKTKTIIYYE